MSIIQKKIHFSGMSKNLRGQKDDLVPENNKVEKL